MSPQLPTFNSLDQPFIYAEVCRDALLSNSICEHVTNLLDFFVVKFRHRMLFAKWIISNFYFAFRRPPFSNHICRIFCWRTKKQMVWSDATFVVAMVTHEHSVRNRTVVQLPRKPMSPIAIIHIVPKDGVAPIARSLPLPTTSRFFDVTPEC